MLYRVKALVASFTLVYNSVLAASSSSSVARSHLFTVSGSDVGGRRRRRPYLVTSVSSTLNHSWTRVWSTHGSGRVGLAHKIIRLGWVGLSRVQCQKMH